MTTLLYAVCNENKFSITASAWEKEVEFERECGVYGCKTEHSSFSENFETETYQVDFDCKISKTWLVRLRVEVLLVWEYQAKVLVCSLISWAMYLVGCDVMYRIEQVGTVYDSKIAMDQIENIFLLSSDDFFVKL